MRSKILSNFASTSTGEGYPGFTSYACSGQFTCNLVDVRIQTKSNSVMIQTIWNLNYEGAQEHSTIRQINAKLDGKNLWAIARSLLNSLPKSIYRAEIITLIIINYDKTKHK